MTTAREGAGGPVTLTPTLRAPTSPPPKVAKQERTRAALKAEEDAKKP